MKLKHLISSARMTSAAFVAAGLMAGGLTASAQSTFKSQDVAALEVINDFLGDQASALPVEVYIDLDKTTDGKDKFRYDYSGTLTIHASSGVAACRAFYDFIKSNGAGISTWSGKRFAMPETITKRSQAEYTSPYRDHQYFNVVTYGYSTPYWDEARWDKELNWMALHGIDMPLMLVGSEQIYRKVFKELYNVTDDQLNEWEVGPAHLPWMRMGNLSGNTFDGPLGDNWHNRQNQLAKHILKRMRELGMKPIVPAFGGFIPKAVAQQVGNYSTTGWDWVIPKGQGNYRLTPTSDGEFKRIGKKFIEEWDKEYESSYGEFKYYLSDSFNEMTVPNDGPTLNTYGEQIYTAIKEGSGNNDAVWVTQGWEFIYGSSKWSDFKFKSLTSVVPNDKFMVLSMSPEYGGYGNKKWENYSNYDGKDWINTMLPNMGGKNFWTGKLQSYAVDFPTTLKNSAGDANCRGWGMTMEGIEYNEMLYELIADMGWEANRTKNLDNWVQEYGKARFGNYSPELQALHTTLRNTVYTSYIDHQNFGWQGNGKSDKYYEGGNIGTTNDTFFQGFETFFNAENIAKLKELAEQGKIDAPLRADLIEFAAFYASARISKVCTRITSLNNQGNKEMANQLIDALDKLMYDVDYVLTGHPLYDEAKWEAKAEAMGDTQDTKDKYRKNARRIVSTWYGDHQGHEAVNDYASRIWAGLMRDYYRPRLVGELRSLVNGTSVNLREIERQFIPNGNVTTKAPALTQPQRVVNGVLTPGDGITDDTSAVELLDFLKQVVDEATEAGEIIIEKSLVDYSTDAASHWYYINSNNNDYLDRAITVVPANSAAGDLRVNSLVGGNNQIWRVVDNYDGTYHLENRDGQSFSWDNGPKTYIANIKSDLTLELDEPHTTYAILPEVLKGQSNCALHFNNSNGIPQAYGYKSGTNYFGGSTWTLAKADGYVAVTSDEDLARICRRINGFKANVWGDETLYGKPGQPKNAAAIETATGALKTRSLALETYTDYLKRYDETLRENFNVPEDAQAHKLFDLIISAFQLNPGSNPTGKAALRTALLEAQTALANGETGDAAKARIAPLETAIKAFITNVVDFPYVSEAPQDGKFVEGSTVITLKCNSTNGGYVTTATADATGLKLTNKTKPADGAGYWVVSGDDTNGYSFYNVGAGAGKVLGFTGTEANARALLYDVASVPSNVTTKFKYGTNANGVPVFYTGTNNAWNDRNGYLAFWADARVFQTDAGSTFTIEVVEGANLGQTTTGGGNQGGSVEGPTATITAVFPDGSKHQVYSDGTKLTAGETVPSTGISTFSVASYNEETGAIVLKAGDKYLHLACGDDTSGKQKMSDWDGLSEEPNDWTTLTLEAANATGTSFTKHANHGGGTWDTSYAGLYQIKGQCSDNTNHYFILRSGDDKWIGAGSNDKFFDSNYDGNGYRTSFFEVTITEPEVVEPELPYVFPLNFDPDRANTRSDRNLRSISLQVEGAEAQTFTVDPAKIYSNLTKTAVFTCSPGDKLIANVGGEVNWMNAYFYIDLDHDKTLKVNNGQLDQSGTELLSYSFWTGSDAQDETGGQNSAGTALSDKQRNTRDLPPFTAPTEPGTYNVRFKLDWNSIDPAGDTNTTNGDIFGNGGYIVDAVLEVVPLSVDATKAEFDEARARYETFMTAHAEDENEDVQDLLGNLFETIVGATLDFPENEADITADQYKAAAAAINAAVDAAEEALQDLLNPVANGLRLPIASGVYEIQNAITYEKRGYLVDYTGYTNGPSLAECQYSGCTDKHPAERNKEGQTSSYWYVHEKDGQYYIISLSSLQEGKLHFLNPVVDANNVVTYSEEPVALTIFESTRTYTVEGDSRTYNYMHIASVQAPDKVISAACGTPSTAGAVKTDTEKTDGGTPWKFIWTSLVPTTDAPSALRTSAIRLIEADATIDRIVDYIEKAKADKALKEDIDLLRDIILKK